MQENPLNLHQNVLLNPLPQQICAETCLPQWRSLISKLMSAIQTWSQRHSPQCCSGLLSVDYVSVYFDSRKDTTPDVTTLVERSEKPMCVHVVWMMCFPFRFTPGVAAQLEKKRTGPSQADVEAIKVHLLTKTWSPVWVLRPGPEFQSVPQPKC